MIKIMDITLPMHPGMVIWPGDPNLSLEREKKIEEGSNANVSRLDMGVHSGTHVDAPYHFVPEGETIEKLSLDVLVGEVLVVRIPDEVMEINLDVLNQVGLPEGIERVLFKTRNSQYWSEKEAVFHPEFVAITPDAAEKLVDLGVKLVGIDYLSIAPYKRSRPTHQILLKAKVVIIEGVDLREVDEGKYRLVCLPLKLVGSDGAPARVILIRDEGIS